MIANNFLKHKFFSWDEWVPEHRVLKYNETNLQRQKELQKEHDAKKEKNKKGNLCYRKVLSAQLIR